ncbi:Anaerobic ribonucleoside-triphosphate reductase [Bacillus cereus Rock3-44]|nr:Anaerobic ribonucleoside-triphosphate reductase [Bacillus cereus Rock3-44]
MLLEVWKMMKQSVREEALMKMFETIVHGNEQDLMQENANVDGRSPMGMMGTFASESAKYYAIEQLLSEQVKKAISQNILYPHDLDFYATGTTTCSQIPLAQMLEKGFHTGHGHMRQPQDIKSALALSSIIFQANQNMQHGGQSFALFDMDLAPYVRKTFERNKKKLETIR